MKDKVVFQEVYLTSRTIEWENGADFAPEFSIELVQRSLSVKQNILLAYQPPDLRQYTEFALA